jgi:hypothetical protein
MLTGVFRLRSSKGLTRHPTLRHKNPVAKAIGIFGPVGIIRVVRDLSLSVGQIVSIWDQSLIRMDLKLALGKLYFLGPARPIAKSVGKLHWSLELVKPLAVGKRQLIPGENLGEAIEGRGSGVGRRLWLVVRALVNASFHWLNGSRWISTLPLLYQRPGHKLDP